MLLVFLMAAVVAMMLYVELPRVAFDAQRQRERLLMARGEQYKRAIQEFYLVNKRWPSKIEDLESFNNRRFLRKRYIDPMTGKDEWRVIHIQNGMLTDSVVTKPPTATDPKNADTFAWGSSSIGTDPGIGQTAAGGGVAGVNLANRKRASDGQQPGLGLGTDGQQPPIDPNNPQQVPGGLPGIPGTPGIPQQPGMVNGQPIPLPPGVTMPPGVLGQVPTSSQYPGQVPGQPGQPGQYPVPLQPFPNQYPGQPVNSQTGGVSPQPYPLAPTGNGNSPGFAQPGTTIDPAQTANQAQQMIQQILTTPRPGGMPANNGQPQTIGGGIAGFASTADAEGIMVYNDRTNYKEWEFVFDPNKYRAPPNPVAGSNGTPASQLGSIGGSQIGTPVSAMPGAGTGTQTPGSPGFGSPIGTLPPRQQ